MQWSTEAALAALAPHRRYCIGTCSPRMCCSMTMTCPRSPTLGRAVCTSHRVRPRAHRACTRAPTYARGAPVQHLRRSGHLPSRWRRLLTAVPITAPRLDDGFKGHTALCSTGNAHEQAVWPCCGRVGIWLLPCLLNGRFVDAVSQPIPRRQPKFCGQHHLRRTAAAAATQQPVVWLRTRLLQPFSCPPCVCRGDCKAVDGGARAREGLIRNAGHP